MSKKYTYLDWIDDDSLHKAVKHVYQQYKKASVETNLIDLHKNVIDPFMAIFTVNLRKNLTFEDWLQKESERQIQKSLSNAVGEFHQKLLGSVQGWVDLGIGDATSLDIRNDDSTIFAEIKNKYNTISGSKLDSAFSDLKKAAEDNSNATCYLVHIIRDTKKPYDKMWEFTEKIRIRKDEIEGDLKKGILELQDEIGMGGDKLKNKIKEWTEQIKTASEKNRSKILKITNKIQIKIKIKNGIEIFIENKNDNPRIRKISGEKFYEMVAGKNSLIQLQEKLPEVINDLFYEEQKIKISGDDSKAYQQLKDKVDEEFTNKKGFQYLFEQAYPNYQSAQESEQLSLFDSEE